MRCFRRIKNSIAFICCVAMLGGEQPRVYAAEETVSADETATAGVDAAEADEEGADVTGAAGDGIDYEEGGYGYLESPDEQNCIPVENDLSYSEMLNELVLDTDEQQAEASISSLQGNSSAVLMNTDIPGEEDEDAALESAYPAPYEETEKWLEYLEQYPVNRRQGSYGTCWAHSAIGLAEFYMISHGLADSSVDYSEMHLVYWNYTQDSLLIAGDSGDRVTVTTQNSILKAGNIEHAANTLMHQRGVALESTVPYSMASGLSAIEASTEREDVLWLENAILVGIKENPEQIKEAILKNGAVAVSYKSNSAYYSSEYNSYRLPASSSITGHAVMVVGWDDNFPKDNFVSPADEDGAWLIRNSWDTSIYAGHNSYFWMSYEDVSLSGGWVFEMSTQEPCDNNYYYDSQIHWGSCRSVADGESIYSANVFRVNGSAGAETEKLTAVSFQVTSHWARSEGSEYTIYVYTGLSDPSDPESGSQDVYATTSGRIYYSGQYTVSLNSSVNLSRGEYFSVVIESEKYSVALEYPINTSDWTSKGLSATVAAKAGQSFFKEGVDGDWVDRSSAGSNFVISALTKDLDYRRLELDPEEYEFNAVGKERQISALVYDRNGRLVEDPVLSFESDDESVVSVSGDGVMHSVSEGSAIVTVFCGDIMRSREIKVTVNPPRRLEFAEGDSYTYTGSAIEPEIIVYNNGIKLTEGVDYTLKYYNNVKASEGIDAQNKKPRVRVSGLSFDAAVDMYFEIERKPLTDSDIVSANLAVKAGSKPAPQLYYGNIKLGSADYSYTAVPFYEDGTLKLSGKGNYSGELEVDISVNAATKIRLERYAPGEKIYDLWANGGAREWRLTELPAAETPAAEAGDYEIFVNTKKGEPALEEGADYLILYPENVSDAGTVKIQIVGIGKYSGTISKTYKIKPLASSRISITAWTDQESGEKIEDGGGISVSFNSAGAKPVPEVKYDTVKLTAGKDYTVAYSNNKKVSTATKKAKVTVRFRGNYKGSPNIVKEFNINPVDLAYVGTDVKIYGLDKVMSSEKEAKYFAKPYVVVNGERITSFNIDYFKAGNAVEAEKGINDKLSPAMIHEAAESRIYVTISGKGNYCGTYSQEWGGDEYAYAVENISRRDDKSNIYDISKASISIVDANGKEVKSIAYTGEALELADGQHVQLNMKLGGVKQTVAAGSSENDPIQIVAYINNIRKGTAYVIVRGTGTEYTGSDGKAYYFYGGRLTAFKIVNGASFGKG